MNRAIVIVGLLAALGGAAWAGPLVGTELTVAGPSLIAGWDFGPAIFWAGKDMDQLATWTGTYRAAFSLVGEVVPALRAGFGGLLDFDLSPPVLALVDAGPYLSLYVAPFPWLVSYAQAGLLYDFGAGTWGWEFALGAWLDFAGFAEGE